MIIWLQRSTYGKNIFLNVGKEYRTIKNVWPTVTNEMPEYLTSIGFPCEYVSDFFEIDGVEVETKGLKMDDEVATALILKYGLR